MKAPGSPSLPPLSPLGTARQKVLFLKADDAAAPPFPSEQLAVLRDAGIEIAPESLYLAWQLCALPQLSAAKDRRDLLDLLVRLFVAQAQGSSRLPLDAAALGLLARASELVGAPGQRKPLVVEGAWLYAYSILQREDRVAAALQRLRARPGPHSAQAVATVCARLRAARDQPLDPSQEAAVAAALQGSLTVIAGGPGTGKTTIVLAIVQALSELGVPAAAIGLAAPTGKAANRLADNAWPADIAPPVTLHRLLGYSPASGTFAHHRNNRLPHRVLIVDEGSMIDLAMMDTLLHALGNDTTLVLLGDADQLPSVQTGSVFKDLAPVAVVLSESHRMRAADSAGRALLDVARAVRQGAGAQLDALLVTRSSPADLLFTGVEFLPASAREAFLQHWYTTRIAPPGSDLLAQAVFVHRWNGQQFDAAACANLQALQRHHQAGRILCLTRSRTTGVDATNAYLHHQFADDVGMSPESAFVPGQPVMMLRNDYDLGLFNGDQGLVVRVQLPGPGAPPQTRLMAAFPTSAGWAVFSLETLRDTLERCFAMTVHKAQGSEFDVVALLLPDAPMPLLSRPLLYTALSRSRAGAVIVGNLAVLASGVANLVTRWSGLEQKLAR